MKLIKYSFLFGVFFIGLLLKSGPIVSSKSLQEKNHISNTLIKRLPLRLFFLTDATSQYQENIDTLLKTHRLFFLEKDTQKISLRSPIIDFIESSNENYIFPIELIEPNSYKGVIFSDSLLSLELLVIEEQKDDYTAKRFILQLFDSQRKSTDNLIIGDYLIGGECIRRRNYSIDEDLKITIEINNPCKYVKNKNQIFKFSIDKNKMKFVLNKN